MRDDIHNKVPLSPAFRALIRRCAIPAYQEQPANLEPYAAKAVRTLIASGCAQDLIGNLANEAKAPSLFGVSTISLSNASALQSDIISALKVHAQSPQQAIAKAVSNQIDGMCLEAVASLRAAGASRHEAVGVERAMRTSLAAATGPIAAELASGVKYTVSKVVLSGSSILPLGPAARATP